jgi:hypothetical protein
VVERSSEHLRPGQQIYAVIEFCNSPETLWRKIQSGKWDWLGVKQTAGRTTFIVGRPRIARMSVQAAGTAIESGADGRYRVEVTIPTFSGVSGRHCLTADGARADYREKLARFRSGGEGSGLFRVRLLVDGIVEEEELVVRAISNVL